MHSRVSLFAALTPTCFAVMGEGKRDPVGGDGEDSRFDKGAVSINEGVSPNAAKPPDGQFCKGFGGGGREGPVRP